MSEELGRYVADVLAITGTVAMTVALTGLVRFPDRYVQLHAASKALIVGTLVVLASSVGSGDVDVMLRAALVGGFLLLTFPVGSYALAGREWNERRAASSEGQASEDALSRR